MYFINGCLICRRGIIGSVIQLFPSLRRDGKAFESRPWVNTLLPGLVDATVSPLVYRTIHVLLLVLLGAAGVVNWRIYVRYAKTYAPETSAIAIMKRLRAEGNPDGTRFLAGNLVGIAAGLGLLVLANIHVG